MKKLLLGAAVGVWAVGWAAGAGPASQSAEAARVKAYRQRYTALVDSWAKGVEFTADEAAAMERGKGIEGELLKGPDDPVGKGIMAKGEASWESVSSVYPGKVLDRTLLGTWSDPTKPIGKWTNEFSIYWNGAIAADLVAGRHNTVVEFRVGEVGELIGTRRKDYSSIGYERGYLPVVVDTYEVDGVRYRETALAWKPEGQTGGWDVAFVGFEITNISPGAKKARLVGRVMLMDGGKVGFKDGMVGGAAGVLVATDGNAKFVDGGGGSGSSPGGAGSDTGLGGGQLEWVFDLAPNETRRAACKVPYVPDEKGLVRGASVDEFDAVHRTCAAFWQTLLDSGAKVEVPEGRVNDVWRALLLQNFVLADGPRFTYGSGLQYNDSTYPYENGFGAHTFELYGHGEYGDALQEWFVKMCATPAGAGRKYQNRRAMMLHHLLETYRLTGKTDLWERHHEDYLRVAEEIVSDRRSTMVLDAKGERPLHWGLLPPDKPGVDVEAATQRAYVLGHSITNCQGLADLGRFLVVTKNDVRRGRRYLKEAADFRECILAAMEKAAIRLPGRPPFVDLQTLYFKETPDFGPEPYDDLGPTGRLQGRYFHYWVDTEFHYNFFNPDDEPGHWLADYVHARNGFQLGLCRARTQKGPAGWVNPVYDGGYYNYRLRCGKVGEFVYGLYARLAFGMSRHVYVSSEGQPMVGYNTVDGGFVGADYAMPNSASNADTLLMLRNAIVMEELKDNVETGTICLLKGVPWAWLGAGKTVKAERMPTYFGEMSVVASGVEGGGIRVEVEPPKGEWKEIAVYVGRWVKEVKVNGEAGGVDGDGKVVIPRRAGKIVVEGKG